MTENNLHEHLQSAYKPGETALVKVQNDILTSIDQHGVVILVMLDLSAAFDTIDHDILFSRMENTLGITGQALAWFKSYLSGRTLRIKIDKSFSELQDILWSLISLILRRVSQSWSSIYPVRTEKSVRVTQGPPYTTPISKSLMIYSIDPITGYTEQHL